MENKEQPKSSSSSSFSSFTADLFGDQEPTSPSSSAGIFASIFPPPSTVLRRNPISSSMTESLLNQSSGNQVWNTKQGTPDNMAKNGEGASNSLPNKDRSLNFQERLEPCPLSSSIYYGGLEDMYVLSSSSQIPGSQPIFKKAAGDDDPNGNNQNSACRGNWWQGSLYY
ncbi:uncharacterized protein LOC132269394 [Cornus florida]|uniref:uncharacterized protein LOC132269394 n=1 Tax=Cornus florida TaxID=4283 RepID=UPI00289C05CA|nr:uncharacterized protein LOC132269394 [Cornus florida]